MSCFSATIDAKIFLSSLPLLRQRRSQPLLPAKTAWSNSAIGLSLVTFCGINKNIVVHARSGQKPTLIHFVRMSITSTHFVIHQFLPPSKECNFWQRAEDLLSSLAKEPPPSPACFSSHGLSSTFCASMPLNQCFLHSYLLHSLQRIRLTIHPFPESVCLLSTRLACGLGPQQTCSCCATDDECLV